MLNYFFNKTDLIVYTFRAFVKNAYGKNAVKNIEKLVKYTNCLGRKKAGENRNIEFS